MASVSNRQPTTQHRPVQSRELSKNHQHRPAAARRQRQTRRTFPARKVNRPSRRTNRQQHLSQSTRVISRRLLIRIARQFRPTSSSRLILRILLLWNPANPAAMVRTTRPSTGQPAKPTKTICPKWNLPKTEKNQTLDRRLCQPPIYRQR